MPTNLKSLCSDRYRVIDDGTDDSERSERVWCLEIPGRHGAIYPHGHGGSLAVRVDSARIAKRFQTLNLKVIQRGDDETVFIFDPRLLDRVAALIVAKRRRRLSPEARAKATERLRRLAAVRSKALSPHSEGGSCA